MSKIPYTKMIYDPLKLAYLAGIVDGEGCLTIYKVAPAKYNRFQNPQYRASLKIANTNIKLVEWLDNEFSNFNSGYKQQKRSIFKKNSTHERWIYEWEVQNFRLVDVLTQIRPYLVLKKRQCEVLLAFRETYGGQTFGAHKPLCSKIIAQREIFLQEIRVLNAKGFLKASLEYDRTNKNLGPCCPPLTQPGVPSQSG